MWITPADSQVREIPSLTMDFDTLFQDLENQLERELDAELNQPTRLVAVGVTKASPLRSMVKAKRTRTERPEKATSETVREAKAASVGAKTVKGPGPWRVVTRSAALRAVTRVVHSLDLAATATIS